MTVIILIGVVGRMASLAYASVTLYLWLRQVNGQSRTTEIADHLPERVLDRVITVRFNADVRKFLT